MQTLLRYKLINHDRKKYDGYKLNYAGYDYLAIRTFLARGHISAVGMQIGVGKESDIFVVTNESGEQFALKLHRLGRVSFRHIKEVGVLLPPPPHPPSVVPPSTPWHAMAPMTCTAWMSWFVVGVTR